MICLLYLSRPNHQAFWYEITHELAFGLDSNSWLEYLQSHFMHQHTINVQDPPPYTF